MRCGRWCSDSITDPWSSAALSLINWIFKSKHSLHQHEPSISALDFPRIFHFPSILSQKRMFSEPHTLNLAWVSLDWKERKLPAPGAVSTCQERKPCLWWSKRPPEVRNELTAQQLLGGEKPRHKDWPKIYTWASSILPSHSSSCLLQL